MADYLTDISKELDSIDIKKIKAQPRKEKIYIIKEVEKIVIAQPRKNLTESKGTPLF